jgi:hypothetical protein
MKDHVLGVATHLEIELDREYRMFTGKAKVVYTVENMNTLEDTFQKV